MLLLECFQVGFLGGDGIGDGGEGIGASADEEGVGERRALGFGVVALNSELELIPGIALEVGTERAFEKREVDRK